MKIKRTNSSNPDFIFLVKQLDLFLSDYNGNDDKFYRKFNRINLLENCIVIYLDNKLAGCGAFKKIDSDTVEIKRMFTLPEYRHLNIATNILQELEIWAYEMGYNQFILETGTELYGAINLYKKQGYKVTENYGQYKGNAKSICFRK